MWVTIISHQPWWWGGCWWWQLRWCYDDDDGDDDDDDKVQSNQRHNFLGHIRRPFYSKGSKAIPAESQKWEQGNMRAREQGSMGSKGFNTTQKIEFYFFIICFPFKKSVHKPLSILPLAMFLVPRSKFSFQISSRRFLEGPFCLWQCFQFPDPDSVFQLSLLESVGFLLPIPSFPPVIRDAIISYPSETRETWWSKYFLSTSLLSSSLPPPPPMFCPLSCPSSCIGTTLVGQKIRLNSQPKRNCGRKSWSRGAWLQKAAPPPFVPDCLHLKFLSTF